MDFDIVIVGGGAVGASAAYFLRGHKTPCSVALVERDPGFALASTPRASGGVRRLFSIPENIRLSHFGIDFFARFAALTAVDGEAVDIGFKRNGYLFVVPPSGLADLAENFRVQESELVHVEWLDPPALRQRFPSMNVADLGAGVFSPDDGWLDPYAVLQGLRRKARSLGAALIADEVVGIETEGRRVRAVRLKSGQVLRCGAVINAAGAWAKEIAAMVGMSVPIEPMRRYEHYFECQDAIEPLPYIKDPDRLAFRPEGKGYSGGVPNSAEPRGYNFAIDHDYFDAVVWPALAHRFPAFERTKVKSTLPGLYDENEFDGNVIIGPWSGHLDNFHLVAGFSGHGLMHAPGCGRAIAELLLDGGYQTIDLSCFGWQRVVEGRKLPERGIK